MSTPSTNDVVQHAAKPKSRFVRLFGKLFAPVTLLGGWLSGWTMRRRRIVWIVSEVVAYIATIVTALGPATSSYDDDASGTSQLVIGAVIGSLLGAVHCALWLTNTEVGGRKTRKRSVAGKAERISRYWWWVLIAMAYLVATVAIAAGDGSHVDGWLNAAFPALMARFLFPLLGFGALAAAVAVVAFAVLAVGGFLMFFRGAFGLSKPGTQIADMQSGLQMFGIFTFVVTAIANIPVGLPDLHGGRGAAIAALLLTLLQGFGVIHSPNAASFWLSHLGTVALFLGIVGFVWQKRTGKKVATA